MATILYLFDFTFLHMWSDEASFYADRGPVKHMYATDRSEYHKMIVGDMYFPLMVHHIYHM